MTLVVEESYVAEIEAWRVAREAALRAPDSWLALTGLYFLTEGSHTIGSAADNAIVLPSSAPAHLGVLEFHDRTAHLHVRSATGVLVNGHAVEHAHLQDNNGRTPTLVTAGTVTFFVHHFGGSYAVRVRDSQNPAIAAFTGCRWYPVKPEYRVLGRYTAHATTQEIPIATAANTQMTYPSTGWVDFSLHGQALRLLARDGGPGKLTFVLRDATSGQTTYGLARFLTAEVNATGTVVLDFNQTYNPPCAFSPFATCPLPPPANILPVAIEAGEMIPDPA